MYTYSRRCNHCGIIVDEWEISEKYYNFLKRSSGIQFEGTMAFHLLACSKCAPKVYMSPNYVASPPFKQKPIPVPAGLFVPKTLSKTTTSHIKAPK
jgi:hypothetical protein